jgi:hypothetical protein
MSSHLSVRSVLAMSSHLSVRSVPAMSSYLSVRSVPASRRYGIQAVGTCRYVQKIIKIFQTNPVNISPVLRHVRKHTCVETRIFKVIQNYHIYPQLDIAVLTV